LGLSNQQASAVRQRMLQGDKSEMPGLVRISFGLYNTIQEVDVLLDALQVISTGKYKGQYIQDKATGEYSPLNWQVNFSDYFKL
jgi:cysteine desulfurase/selenocysteine lyase